MDIDPKKLNDEERQKLMEKVKAEQKPPVQQEESTKSFEMGTPEQDEKTLGVQVDKLDERIVSPQKLKDIFDKMTEIDTNPRAKSSLEFSQKMEELERNNQYKKQGQITIKTIRRGRVRGVSQEKFETDSTGRVKMLDKRIIRYGEV